MLPAVSLSSEGTLLMRRLFSFARCSRQMKHTCTDRSRSSSGLAPHKALPMTSCSTPSLSDHDPAICDYPKEPSPVA